MRENRYALLPSNFSAVRLSQMPSIHQREIKKMVNSKQIFKCTEKEGYYITNQEVSEQDILSFAQSIIENKFKRGTIITSPRDSADYLKSKIGHLEHEVFAAIFLDTKHQIIAFEELFQGTIDSASVYPREIAKRALHHNAAAIIFTHNHPSGNTEPSMADISLTTRLVSAMELLGIKALDHIIVAGNNSQSLAEMGHI